MPFLVERRIVMQKKLGIMARARVIIGYRASGRAV